VTDAEKQGTRAEIARRGLHDLQPYWSPDSDSMVDPLDEDETRTAIRTALRQLFRDGFLPSRTSAYPKVNAE
jgi:hypothetical protein